MKHSNTPVPVHSEERLLLALQVGRIATWEWDLSSGHVLRSDTARELLGLASGPAEEFQSRIHAADREGHHRALRAALASGELYDAEFRFLRTDGTTIWIRDRAQLHTGPEGQQVLIGTLAEITARKEAERLAREKTALLEATLENMDQGLMVMDADRHVTLYNKRALELLGLPDHLLASRPHIESVKNYQARMGDFAPADDAALQLTTSKGFFSEPRTYERTRPNGTVLEIRTVPLPDGRAVRTYTDITGRQQAEAQVRESAERLTLATKATADAMWDWNLDQDQIHWNKALEALFGYPSVAVEEASRWWKERIHPDDRERVVGSIEAVIAGSGSHWSDEYRFQRADGAFAFVFDRGYLMRDAKGRPYRMVGAMQDLTERRAAEESLRDSEARYRLLADNTSDMVIQADLTGLRLYVSPASFDILGFQPVELVGTRPTEFVHPDDEDGLRAKVMALGRGEIDHAWNIHRFRHKNGSWVWVEVKFRLVRNEAGEPQEVVSSIRDISERVRLEAQLRQSQKMEAMGQLTGGIAHDFNNLLTVVLGNAEILSEEITDPRLKEFADQIQAAAERGSDLNQKLLAFGRRQSLRPSLVRLDEAVLGLSVLLKRAVGEPIDLRTETAGGRTQALVDRTHLESAVLNLAVNARDAMPQGGVLTISTDEVADASAGPGLVRIRVTDTGCGMSPEVLERVFEPFFTTKEVGKGSGLGLAMVHGFVEQSGGRISIESRVGAGTTVTILLPAAHAEGKPEATGVSSTASMPAGTERVLVVEDAADVRRYATSTLLALGYEVLEAPDGEAALAILEQGVEVDLLFTDVVLPKGINGVELARKARGKVQGLKVVCTSGYPEEAFRRYGRPEEDMPLLLKPYRRAALAEAVRQALEPSGTRSSASRPSGL